MRAYSVVRASHAGLRESLARSVPPVGVIGSRRNRGPSRKGFAAVDRNLDHDETTRRKTSRRGAIALLAAVAALTFGAGSMSLALFTDNDASTWSFTTGTIDITASPTAVTAVTDMMPGDSDTAPLTIANAGNAAFRYAMSASATNSLGAQLQLTVRAEDAGGGCAAFTGAVIVASGTPLNGAGFGSAAQGAQAGDRILAAGTSEVLCFRVSLPLTTGDPFQGVTSVASFAFAAEQTANNP